MPMPKDPPVILRLGWQIRLTLVDLVLKDYMYVICEPKANGDFIDECFVKKSASIGRTALISLAGIRVNRLQSTEEESLELSRTDLKTMRALSISGVCSIRSFPQTIFRFFDPVISSLSNPTHHLIPPLKSSNLTFPSLTSG